MQIEQTVEPCVVRITGTVEPRGRCARAARAGCRRPRRRRHIARAGPEESVQLAASIISDIVNGSFKGFALLRQFANSRPHQQQPEPGSLHSDIAPCVYKPGTGLIPLAVGRAMIGRSRAKERDRRARPSLRRRKRVGRISRACSAAYIVVRWWEVPAGVNIWWGQVALVPGLLGPRPGARQWLTRRPVPLCPRSKPTSRTWTPITRAGPSTRSRCAASANRPGGHLWSAAAAAALQEQALPGGAAAVACALVCDAQPPTRCRPQGPQPYGVQQQQPQQQQALLQHGQLLPSDAAGGLADQLASFSLGQQPAALQPAPMQPSPMAYSGYYGEYAAVSPAQYAASPAQQAYQLYPQEAGGLQYAPAQAMLGHSAALLQQQQEHLLQGGQGGLTYTPVMPPAGLLQGRMPLQPGLQMLGQGQQALLMGRQERSLHAGGAQPQGMQPQGVQQGGSLLLQGVQPMGGGGGSGQGYQVAPALQQQLQLPSVVPAQGGGAAQGQGGGQGQQGQGGGQGQQVLLQGSGSPSHPSSMPHSSSSLALTAPQKLLGPDPPALQPAQQQPQQ